MSIQSPKTQSTMTTSDMSKTFVPIIIFSIVLPIIDIATDLRIIIRLFSGITSCVPYDDIEKLNPSVVYTLPSVYADYVQNEGGGYYCIEPIYYDDTRSNECYFVHSCRPGINGEKLCQHEKVIWNVSYSEWNDCRISDDLSTFCQQYPNLCKSEKHTKFATLLLGEYIS